MKQYRILLAFVLALVLALPTALASSGHDTSTVAPDTALQLLRDGNARFVSANYGKPDIGQSRRTELTKGQHPFAVIVSCSDSRVPPELVFDQGLGNLFVVRTAGEVVDDVALGSIEYAVEHLGAKLVVVMGHEQCGAVKAAVAGGEAPGHLPAIVGAIAPAVAKAKTQPGDVLQNSIAANVDLIVNKLQTSEPVLQKAAHHEIKIVGAVYHLDSGSVDFR